MKSAVSVAMEGKYSPKMFELPDLLDSEAIVDHKVGITVDSLHPMNLLHTPDMESGGTPPGNFAILHALKCILGSFEAPFCAYIYSTYIPVSCRLCLAVSDQKVRPYGALANGCVSSH